MPVVPLRQLLRLRRYVANTALWGGALAERQRIVDEIDRLIAEARKGS